MTPIIRIVLGQLCISSSQVDVKQHICDDYAFPSLRSPNPPDYGPSAVTWPQFTEQEQEYLVLDVKPRVESRYQAKRVAFWNEVVPKVLELEKADKKKADEKAPKDEL